MSENRKTWRLLAVMGCHRSRRGRLFDDLLPRLSFATRRDAHGRLPLKYIICHLMHSSVNPQNQGTPLVMNLVLLLLGRLRPQLL